MADETTKTSGETVEDTKPKTTRRRSTKIKPGDKVRARVLTNFVDGRVGEESVVEATEILLDLEAKGYVRLTREED